MANQTTATPSTSASNAVSDRELIRLAYRLTADLARPNAAIYWFDLIASSAVGYGGFALAWHLGISAAGVAAIIVSALAFYRGISMIHELVHLKRRTPRFYWTAWHALIGVPLLVPLFLYEGIHNLHHSKAHYGTAEDPEYLPLASYRPRATLLALPVAAIEPLLLVIRFLIIIPAAALIPPFRPIVVAQMSAMVMNTEFRRKEPPPGPRAVWIAMEVVTAAYVWAVALMTIAGFIPWRMVVLALAMWSAVSMVNMARTLIAHHYANDAGEPLEVIAQVLDSTSVPPPAVLPMLWAPVGLRYHALHHLLPNLPYHGLGEAHRRLTAGLPAGNSYQLTAHRRARDVMAQLLKAQARSRRPAIETGVEDERKLARSVH